MKNLVKFEEKVSQILLDWKVPGAAIGILHQGEIVHAKGYGWRDLEKKLPVDPASQFAIGSTSKAFTGVAAAILVDRGLLDWDEPVRTYMPDFALWDSFASERMTVRDLLSHRSGLPRHDGLWYGSSVSRDELMGRLRYLQPSADFRTTFQYQNLMFMAAGALVERISGQTWEDFTRENILEPLGMTTTTLSVVGIRSSTHAARPYASTEDGHKLLEYRNLDTISPAGGINSCLDDLFKWLAMQLGGGRYRDTRILSSENLRQTHTEVTWIENAHNRMLQNYAEIGRESYALGWFVHHYRGHRLIRHGGHIDGFSTQISLMPEMGAGVIVLSNIGGSSFMFAPTFLAYDLLLGLEPLDWSARIRLEEERSQEAGKRAGKWFASQRRKKAPPSHSLQDYTGLYWHPGYGEMTILQEKGKLSAIFNDRRIELTHFHYDTFDWPTGRASQPPLKISFFSDPLGQVVRLAVQLEMSVDPIQFERRSDLTGLEDASLEGLCGEYSLDGETVVVSLDENRNLRALIPGYAPLELSLYRDLVFSVDNQPNWYVEFAGLPAKEFYLVQPNSLRSVKKTSM